ncbi:hypothetical protein NUACC21_50180 [Scytonema sp. NUACC21]
MAVLGVSSFTHQLAWAQSNRSSYPSQGTGNYLNYPSGTRVYPNGRITTPTGGTIYPSNTIDNGNGSKTYYYQNGTRVIIRKETVNNGGAFLSPNSSNGGLPTSPNQTLPAPGNFNRGLK